MKRIAYFIAAIAAVAVVGCQKFENENTTSGEEVKTLTGAFEESKTQLSGNKPIWLVGDKIHVIGSNGYNEEFTVVEGSTKTADSEAIIVDGKLSFDVTPTVAGEIFYAVYPASAAVSTKVTNDVVEFTTTGQDGSFAKANICVAKENNGILSFKNATAIVKLTNAKTVGVQYIDIKPTTGYMFGTCSADLSSAIAVSAPSKGNNYSFGTNYDVDSKVNKSDVPVFSNDAYYLAVPYGLEYSIVAEAYGFNGGLNKILSVTDLSKKNPLTPERNIIYTCAFN